MRKIFVGLSVCALLLAEAAPAEAQYGFSRQRAAFSSGYGASSFSLRQRSRFRAPLFQINAPALVSPVVVPQKVFVPQQQVIVQEKFVQPQVIQQVHSCPSVERVIVQQKHSHSLGIHGGPQSLSVDSSAARELAELRREVSELRLRINDDRDRRNSTEPQRPR